MILKQQEELWLADTLEQVKAKLRIAMLRNQDKLPYISADRVFDCRPEKMQIVWWVTAFWGGIMWQMYSLTEDSLYKESACAMEARLDSALMNMDGLDYDNGFKWLTTAVAHYRVEKDPDSYNRAILAASHLAGRFNLAGRYLRAWNDWGRQDHCGWAIIDSLMSLPLLCWATEETRDPRFCQIAGAHADTVMEQFVRPDGSVRNIVEFDPFSGKVLRFYEGWSYRGESVWSRGQAWAIYGFTLAYLHTRSACYLDTAISTANYFVSRIPEDGLIPVNFCQPGGCNWEDTTASAIAAGGLLELSKVAGDEDRYRYRRAAVDLLVNLVTKRCNWAPEADYLLEKCTASYQEEKRKLSIIYGDYFLIEALLKLAGKDLFIW